MQKFFLAVLFVGLSLVFAQLYINWQFQKEQQERVTAQDEIIWSHRGVHIEEKENTIAAFQLAKQQGFKGIELDVFYDVERGLVVSHDQPYQLHGGAVLKLETVLEVFKNDFYYWVDFKNLDKKNVEAVRAHFQVIFENHNALRSKVFIESANGKALQKLSKDNINTIYWVQYAKKQPKKWIKLNYTKWIIGHSDFVGITSHYRYIDEEFENIFKHLNWFVFTVNDLKTIEKLMNIDATNSILTDLEGNDVFEK